MRLHKLICFIVPILITIMAYLGYRFLEDYYLWERYAYPPHTYIGLVAGIICAVLTLISTIVYFLWIVGYAEEEKK